MVDTVTIRQVQTADNAIVSQIVNIHLETFSGFFLTFMGRGFLRQMYKAYVTHANSGVLVAEDENGVVGFLAYSENLSGLYKYMIKTRLIPFAWYSLGAFLRKPTVFMRLIRAFLKPGESRREEKYVELASIGVSPRCKGAGVGTQLVSCLKELVDFDVFAYISLETDAVNDEGANRFYVKNGLMLEREYETHEGRKMNEYRYEGKHRDEKEKAAVHT